ncbi:MAG: MurR/RpiR family transcriptional regulator [Oscillospiraceae bacterium]
MDILEQISAKWRSLSKGQKYIAGYIQEHADKAAFMTAAKLGNTVGVSESTVVRFACELGFNGYPEMSKTLQQTIKAQLTSVQRIAVTKDRIGSGNILESVLISDMDKIKRTLEETCKEDFNKAAEAIANARNIYILGDRSASALARFMEYYFNLMFNNVRMIHTSSSSELYEQIIRLGSEDVLIGISFPRYSNLTVEAFEFAAQTGAPIVAITDGKSSPLAKDASFLLTARSDMTSFVDSLVAPLSLINALIAAVGLQKQEEVMSAFNHLENIWKTYHVYQNSDNKQ